MFFCFFLLKKENCTCCVQLHGELCDQVELECTKHAPCLHLMPPKIHIERATIVFSQAK